MLFFPLVANAQSDEATDDPGAATPTVAAANDVEINTNRTFNFCEEPQGNTISASHLLATARCAFKGNETKPTVAVRMTLMEDLHIKTWSYAIFNKIFFWISVVLALTVLAWPTVVSVFRASLTHQAAAEALELAKLHQVDARGFVFRGSFRKKDRRYYRQNERNRSGFWVCWGACVCGNRHRAR